MMALCQTLGGQPSVIKTLGPQSTDSYNAAHFWCKKNDSKVPIVVYPSFDNLFEQMEANDYIVMPLGY